MLAEEFVEAIVLAVVQGVAEFLPISSSGHLVIIGAILREAFGRDFDPAHSLQLNVALHLGTLFSILVVFRRDLKAVLGDRQALRLIVAATIPIVIVGFLCSDFIERNLQTPLSAGICLLATAGLLLLARRVESGRTELRDLRLGYATAVGVFQAVAILPGVSRSGSTIAGGLMLGMQREAAARFSFLIAIPAILGAVILTVREMIEHEHPAYPIAPLCTGVVIAFLIGLISLKWLLAIVARGQLHWFAWYCLAIGGATIIWQLVV